MKQEIVILLLAAWVSFHSSSWVKTRSVSREESKEEQTGATVTKLVSFTLSSHSGLLFRMSCTGSTFQQELKHFQDLFKVCNFKANEWALVSDLRRNWVRKDHKTQKIVVSRSLPWLRLYCWRQIKKTLLALLQEHSRHEILIFATLPVTKKVCYASFRKKGRDTQEVTKKKVLPRVQNCRIQISCKARDPFQAWRDLSKRVHHAKMIIRLQGKIDQKGNEVPRRTLSSLVVYMMKVLHDKRFKKWYSRKKKDCRDEDKVTETPFKKTVVKSAKTVDGTPLVLVKLLSGDFEDWTSLHCHLWHHYNVVCRAQEQQQTPKRQQRNQRRWFEISADDGATFSVAKRRAE